MKTRTVNPVQRLHRVVEQAKDGLAITDAGGGLLYANKALAEIHGFQPETYVSEAFAAIAAPDQLRLLKMAGALVAVPGGFDLELRCEHRNGTHFKTRLNRSCVTDAHGNLIGIVFVCRNPSAARPAVKQAKPAQGRATSRPAAPGDSPPN